MADKDNKGLTDQQAQAKAAREGSAPQVGGVSTDTGDVFNTSGPQPVRDRVADPSKGTPVTRYFTKDGTPIEPSTMPPAQTPANLAGFDVSKREDAVAVVEYLDEGGNVVTHDNLKASRDSK